MKKKIINVLERHFNSWEIIPSAYEEVYLFENDKLGFFLKQRTLFGIAMTSIIGVCITTIISIIGILISLFALFNETFEFFSFLRSASKTLEFLLFFIVMYGVTFHLFKVSIKEKINENELNWCLKVYNTIELLIPTKLTSKDELANYIKKSFVYKKNKLISVTEAVDQLFRL